LRACQEKRPRRGCLVAREVARHGFLLGGAAAAAQQGYDRRRSRKRQHCRWNKSDLRRVLLYSHTSPRPFASKAGLFYARFRNLGHVARLQECGLKHRDKVKSMKNGHPLVAIVDDEESFRTALGRLITSYGLNIATFESGQTLLDSLPARQPDCVLLDFSMPGLNGMDVLRLLQTAGWKLPVIMVTGRDQPTLRAQCLAAGAMAYFQKPADSAEFLQAIGKAVGGRAS
jgi:CheY-like chemotaxis protein